MFQIKEQNKSLEVNCSEMETRDLPNREFKNQSYRWPLRYKEQCLKKTEFQQKENI